MRLTTFTDYTLRALMYLGANRDRLVTIQEIADAHGVSKNHLTKVVHQLGLAGLVETIRGRHGGLRLKLEPSAITLGEVVRCTESDFHMAECFDEDSAPCPLAASCRLRFALAEATSAYLAVLDSQSLESLLAEEARGAVSPLIFQRTAPTP